MRDARSKLVRDWERLRSIAERHRASGKIITVTFGAFDIVHPGHLLYLEATRGYGHTLIVGITSDRSVRAIKGPSRPVNPEHDRALVVAGFWCVDHMFVFDSDDCRFIETVRPDVCVYSETSEKKMEQRGREKTLVEWYGGKILCLPSQSDRHTSDIIRTMKA
jgi:rfaE bifunctional protein nucleotidyltransferase chain/domain